MSQLQILIPQYNEDEAVIRPLLDSIEHQINIDLKSDIEVFIGNDGSNTKLSVDFLKSYTFPIQYHFFEHGGLAATRYKLQHLATAPYIMFCDADDLFINSIAISLILQQTAVDFDMLVGDFIEECKLPNKEIVYIPHTDDTIFVHAKVYKLAFLKENHIEWHPELHEHQDSAFNVLARTCAKKVGRCVAPLYLWHYNEKSICRHDGIYHSPNTWPHMIDSYDAFIGDLKDRGYGQESSYYAKYCLYATYYEMSHEIWNKEDVQEQKVATYKRLVEFYTKHELLIKRVSNESTEKIIKITMENAEKKSPLINDMPPFDEWLNSILAIWR